MPLEELMSAIGKLLDAAQDSGGNLGMSDADMMHDALIAGWGRNQQQFTGPFHRFEYQRDLVRKAY